MSATISIEDRTIRLLIDWPIQGLWMKGWIVQKDARAAARLVALGFAEYVRFGTTPPASQLEWARSIVTADQDAHPESVMLGGRP